MKDDQRPAVKPDFRVGYKKPPLEHQFKTGHCANRRGRPKGAKNLKTDLFEELRELVSLTEGGKAKRLTKQRIMVKGLLNKAMKGDIRAINAVLNMNLRLFGIDDEGSTPEEMSQEDEVMLALALKRLDRNRQDDVE